MLKAHQIDTIILDNRMPGRTGLEGLNDIRLIDTDVSIIMLTGYGTLETACEAFRNQATDFMTKPPDTDAMLEAVAKNVALTRGKRTRASVSRELSDLNQSLSAELNETRPLAKLGQRSDEIIHDMGNPLTILTCCIELLQTKVDEMRFGRGQPVDGSARLHPDDQKKRPALLRAGGCLAAGARRYFRRPGSGPGTRVLRPGLPIPPPDGGHVRRGAGGGPRLPG